MKITVGTSSAKLSDLCETAGILTKINQIWQSKLIVLEVITSGATIYLDYGDSTATTTWFPLAQGWWSLTIAIDYLNSYSVIGSTSNIDVRLLVM